jgi:hypothetical protein
MQTQPPIESRPVASAVQSGVRALGQIVWTRERLRVTVVGASKNAGKTTTLNALAAAASQAGERIGLVSIGVDGEAFDAWLDIPKPRVHVEKGTLVVTAARMAAEMPGLLRVLQDTGFASALGPTVLAEARGPGGVQLCGVPHRGHIIRAVAQLQERGADRVLVDGAYHRQAAAHADVADAVVLAIGAVLGDTATEAAERAALTLQALATPAWRGDTKGVLPCPGALTDRWLQHQDLAQISTVLVAGPSQVLLGVPGRADLARRGIAIVANRPVPLVAVTTNPYRPGGIDDGAVALQDAVLHMMRRYDVQVPVVDVVGGLAREGG